MELFLSPKMSLPAFSPCWKAQSSLIGNFCVVLLTLRLSNLSPIISVTYAGRSSAAASDKFWMSAFSGTFLSTGSHFGERCCCSYSNSLGWALFTGPILFNSFKYSALGNCFQLLHFLLSVLCSCSSDILPCADNTNSARDDGLGSLSRDLAEVTCINKTQAATQSHNKYSSWSCIITHSILIKGCECIFKYLSIKSQNILLRYCKLGDKGINLPNADMHLLQKLNSTSQLLNNAHLNSWMMNYSHRQGN